MEKFKLSEYYPAVRAGQYDLLALNEVDLARKERLSPIISIRGNSPKLIESFIDKWGNTPCWIDVSRFPMDANSVLASKLNVQSNNFSEKHNFFVALMKANPAVLPVVGFNSGDKTRSIVQFALNMLQSASYIAIRLEGSEKVLDKNINHVRAVLNAISDSDFERVALIVDRGSIATPPSLQEGSSVMRCMELLEEFPVRNVITLSTSWPDERPERGKSAQSNCIDPSWQARLHSMLAGDVNFAYGDYAATNPIKDLLDSYDPRKMAPPIPFAGYFAPLYWHQERMGAGGENEKYRDIAKVFRSLPDYHTDNFCWGTKEIAAIAMNKRAQGPGNMAFWNKIRINQHVCAMLEALEDGLLEFLVSPEDEDIDDSI